MSTAQNSQLLVKASAKLKMSVDKTVLSYIRGLVTPKEIWDALQKAFADSGLNSKVNLLRKLITIRPEVCKSMDEYVDTIVTTVHKLSTMDFTISQEWLGVLLLVGLPESFKPMIMTLESSGCGIKGDSIEVKLLQKVNFAEEIEENSESALQSYCHSNRDEYNSNKKRVICFKCNVPRQHAFKCRSRNYNKPKGQGNSAFYAEQQNNELEEEEILFMLTDDTKSNCKNDCFVDSKCMSYVSGHAVKDPNEGL